MVAFFTQVVKCLTTPSFQIFFETKIIMMIISVAIAAGRFLIDAEFDHISVEIATHYTCTRSFSLCDVYILYISSSCVCVVQ